MTPRRCGGTALSGGPSMLNVLPLPVWPKANTHALKPSATDATSGSTSV